ncbi:MAG: hypothetical protein K0R60_68 [Microbacterium sp.]|jgi:hypothetical protein|nr:hypothetical protein [Microbacterium sp.]
MSRADVVLAVYWLAMAALIVIAVAVAIWYSGLERREARIPKSLDCAAGIHGGCPICECDCHEGGAS